MLAAVSVLMDMTTAANSVETLDACGFGFAGFGQQDGGAVGFVDYEDAWRGGGLLAVGGEKMDGMMMMEMDVGWWMKTCGQLWGGLLGAGVDEGN